MSNLSNEVSRSPTGVMARLKDLSVARKTALILGILTCGTAIAVGSSMLTTSKLGARIGEVGDVQLPAVRNMTLADMYHDGTSGAVYCGLYAASVGDHDGVQSSFDEVEGFASKFKETMSVLVAAPLQESTKRAIAEAQPAIELYVSEARAVLQAVRAGDLDKAKHDLPEFQNSFAALEVKFDSLGDLIEKDASASVGESREEVATAKLSATVLLLVLAALSVAAGLFSSRQITRPLRTTLEVLESGDLSKLAEITSRDEIGRMAMAVTSMVQKMQRQQSDMARVVSMMENAPINMLYADPDGRIQYVNPSSLQALDRVGPVLGLTEENVKGAAIARFFTTAEGGVPDLSRAELLPYTATVEIGPEIVDLMITALFDHQHTYLGPMLTWEITTERVQLQRHNDALAAKQRQQAEELRERAEREAGQVRERAELERRQAEERRLAAEAANRATAERAEQERRQGLEVQVRIDALLQAVDLAAKGDLRQRISIQSDDAVGKVGGALDAFLVDLRQSIETIGKHSRVLAGSSDNLIETSRAMQSTAEQTSQQMSVVSEASGQVSRSVQGVATATEQMGASIREIAKNAADATRVAQNAVEAAASTTETMSRLSDSSQQIGEVVKLIRSIAQQTNLLALNATIEAARAGEAGRGFAVVANEVKELANETSRATGEIGQRIDAIQGDSRLAREAIARIGEIVHEISAIQGSIAAAVEEQTATTSNISQSLAEAARGSNEIVETISTVARSAQDAAQGAESSLQSAESMAKMAEDLQELVGAFQY